MMGHAVALKIQMKMNRDSFASNASVDKNGIQRR